MQQHFTPSDHGGMGLGIIKKLTQTFEITPLIKGNRTKLIFALERR
jgi:anti-sigma regulatory factor (Ser/Thr protein kinase)